MDSDNGQRPEAFLVPAPLMGLVIRYLVRQPYGDVVGLIDALNVGMQPVVSTDVVKEAQ